MQNINRCDSFDKIDIRFFKETWPEQPVKMTLSAETLPSLARGIVYMSELGFEVVTGFAAGIDWSQPENSAVLQRELLDLCEFYLSHPEIKPSNILGLNIAAVADSNPGDPPRWCGAGVHMRTYNVDGRAYPCHYFMPITLGEEKAGAAREIDFSESVNFCHETCDSCAIRAVCPTCYGANFAAFGDVKQRDQNVCRLNKEVAKANSYFAWKQIEKYGIEKAAQNYLCSESALINAILKIQEAL